MTSYLNSLSGHVANIRRLIPTSMSPESDLSVNDPEDSHVSRVLRAYYTEKGRPFPPWLGPDPRAPSQAVPVYANAMGQRNQGVAPSMGSARGGRGLGDLFGDSQGSEAPQQESMSLRQPRRPAVGRAPASSGVYNDTSHAARPLPSQRVGSYQNRPNASAIPPSNATLAPETDLRRAPSAQDRLKARFGGGGRSGSAASNRSTGSAVSANAPWQTGGDEYSGHGGYGGR